MKLHPTGVLLRPDNKRVVVRPFIPINPTRVEHIIARALALSEQETEQQLSLVRADFSERHIDLDKSWLRHFDKVRGHIQDSETISEARRYLSARSSPASMHSNRQPCSIPRLCRILTRLV
jgi:hypothetical protein